MKPSRTLQDENCPNEIRFRSIESHFLTNMTYGIGGFYVMAFPSIKSIDIVTNDNLTRAFEKNREEFKSRNYMETSHEIIYAYHGTNTEVINQILRENFNFTKALSSHFCKILPGKQYKGPNMSWEGHDSKLVSPDKNGMSQMVIIQNKDQILPCGVIHLS